MSDRIPSEETFLKAQGILLDMEGQEDLVGYFFVVDGYMCYRGRHNGLCVAVEPDIDMWDLVSLADTLESMDKPGIGEETPDEQRERRALN